MKPVTIRAIKYLDLHGKPVTARFNDGSGNSANNGTTNANGAKAGVPHVVFKDAGNQTVLAPIMSETTWETFVLGLQNDPTAKVEVIE